MKKFSMVFVAVMCLTFLGGCVGTTTTTWVKKSVTKAQMEKDLQECSQRSGLLFTKTGAQGQPMAQSSQASYAGYMGEPFEKCMRRIGYKKEKK